MRYDSHVTRMIRFAIAMALAWAVAVVPLVADWCAVSCESAHASAAAGLPPCHHSSASIPRVGHVPTPCGHDHHPVVVDASITAIASRAIVSILAPAVDPGGAAFGFVTTTWHAGADFRQPSTQLPLALASPLRI
jgi:hypothetical protein